MVGPSRRPAGVRSTPTESSRHLLGACKVQRAQAKNSRGSQQGAASCRGFRGSSRAEGSEKNVARCKGIITLPRHAAGFDRRLVQENDFIEAGSERTWSARSFSLSWNVQTFSDSLVEIKKAAMSHDGCCCFPLETASVVQSENSFGSLCVGCLLVAEVFPERLSVTRQEVDRK